MTEDESSLVAKDLGPSGSFPNDWAPRKLAHAQARMEQRLYWSRKSIPERLAAMTI